MQGSGKPIVTVNNVEKHYRSKRGVVDILHKTSFLIPESSFAIIYGQSGSGKSTMLNILAGLDPPSGGSVNVLGQDLYSLTTDQRAHFRAEHVGIVHQVNYWVKSLSVVENVALPLLLNGHHRVAALKAAHESLDHIGMVDFARAEPSVLSGGEQQRVSVARALIANPKLLFADEPTGNLDSRNGRLVIELLRKINQELGCSIVLVTHNLEYLQYSTEQIYIKDGYLKSHVGAYEDAL
ncbi:MAG: ABC transporter ATP-binding protein [Candidatus Saccharimonas sp.]